MSGDGSTRPFAWAVVGIGRHSRQYLLPAVAQASGSRLAALVSSDPDSARAAAAPWGEPVVYTDYTDALADPQIDGVFLVSPNHVHREQVVAAARAGKHVLCEKPLATSSADAAAMVAAAREHDVTLGTGFHLRHNRVHREARRLVAEGRIGALRFADVRYWHRTAPRPLGRAGAAATASLPPVAAWRSDPAVAGGGAFVSTGSHAIDLLRFLTGDEVVEVQARADAPDLAERDLALVASLGSGALATVHGGDLAYPVNETVLSGTDGSIVCRGSVGNVGAGTLEILDARGRETFSPALHDVYVEECASFVAAARTGGEADASGLDGLRCQEVVEAAYEAAASARAVRVEHSL